MRSLPRYSSFLFLFLSAASSALPQTITDEAQHIYRDSKPAVYQIQAIDLGTGKKHAIGSGFQIDRTGLIATNYHVVASVVNEPSKFRLEYISHNDEKGMLSVVGIDVIHDLAIARRAQRSPGPALKLGRSDFEKGATIFSMGNPYDLGMTIIEGTFNGVMEQALYRKILFSGSLNPGMSGGPALDHDGEVIGVNVATQGNQISFLVPVEYLTGLYKKVMAGDPPRNWKREIETQLFANQREFLAKTSQSAWKTLDIGEAVVPGEFSENFRCWGRSDDRDKSWVTYSYSYCSNDDGIFLSDDLQTGRIVYKYGWITSKSVNPFRFYNYYQWTFSRTEQYSNAGEEDVTNFECRSDFVRLGGRDFKASLCARNYKDFPSLFDINLSFASIDQVDRGLAVELAAFGVGKESSDGLLTKFMKNIRWKN